MNNKLFDILKWTAMFMLPAFATFYFAIAQVWNLQYTTEIVGTIIAVNLWLSALLAIENAQYQSYITAKQNNVVLSLPGVPFAFNTYFYERIKWIVIIFLPSTSSLYLTISLLWNLPYGEQVIATVSALTAFLGATLGFSQRKFDKDAKDKLNSLA